MRLYIPIFVFLILAVPRLSLGVGSIGYVDFNRAINEVSDGKRAKLELKGEFREKQRQLERLQADLGKLRDSIDRERMLLSPETVEEREGLYRQKFSELQLKLENYKKELSAKETELTQGILQRLRSIVNDIGKEGGYTLILEKSQDVVLYAPDVNDLTNRVIEAYDRRRGKKK